MSMTPSSTPVSNGLAQSYLETLLNEEFAESIADCFLVVHDEQRDRPISQGHTDSWDAMSYELCYELWSSPNKLDGDPLRNDTGGVSPV